MLKRFIVFVLLSGMLTISCGCSGTKKVNNSHMNQLQQPEITKKSDGNPDAGLQFQQNPTVEYQDTGEASYITNGSDSSYDVIEEYITAFVECNPEKVYSLIHPDEISIINRHYNADLTKDEIIYMIENYMYISSSAINQSFSNNWLIEYYSCDDLTDEAIASSDHQYYAEISFQKAERYDGVYLVNADTGEKIECISDDIDCIQINNKWYLQLGILQDSEFLYDMMFSESTPVVDENIQDTYEPADSNTILMSDATDVIDSFVRAYCNGDAEAVYSLIYVKEIELLNDYYGAIITKSDIIASISSEMSEAVATYNLYKDHHWISTGTVCEDVTSILAEGDETTPSYSTIGLEAAYLFDSVYFKNITKEMYIECMSDDIICLKIDGKWYLCLGCIL